MSRGFYDRLAARIGKLDPESLQAQMLRLAQERGFLETIFQTIQEGVLVISNSGTLLYANNAAESMMGFDFNRMRNKSVIRYLREWEWEHLLEMPEVQEGWARMAAREIEVSYPEHRFLSVYAVPLSEEGVLEKGVLVILRDVTRDRMLEADAVESGRSDAIKLLAAGVAHEIGNPLNALNIHLQLLGRETKELQGEVRIRLLELVNIARSEVARLDNIITQFLSAIRPAAPVMHAECPADVLQDSLRLLENDFENRRIRVEVEVPDQVPAVLLDRSQIKQVYFNLIKNALEAMPDGGSLRILFHVGDAFVDISFIDSGAGIALEEMGRVFEPYHTTKSKGSGLGLMIVKRIIEEHGGEIEIASKLGEGSSIKLRLPRNERRIRLLKTRSPHV